MMKMTNGRVKLGIDWILKKGETVDEVSNTFKVSTRRLEQLVKIFKETGEYQVLNPNRRPKMHLTEEQKRIIKQAAYSESYFGAGLLRHHIKKRYK
jgi:putative transposase